jgi:hypothetical protein
MRLDNRNLGMNFFNEINADKENRNFLWCCKPVSMRLRAIKALQAFFADLATQPFGILKKRLQDA